MLWPPNSSLSIRACSHLFRIHSYSGHLGAPSPNLQRKASSILEFLTIIEQHLDTILLADIESGLEAVFQKKILDDTESDMDDLELTFRSGKTCG